VTVIVVPGPPSPPSERAVFVLASQAIIASRQAAGGNLRISWSD